MAEKLDLLIKEFNDYFDKEIAKLEVTYKKFADDYNKAILNTQPFDVFKANDDETKDWPKDVFPDKPEIKTYGDFYKWLFNKEYGSIYYDKSLFTNEKYLDTVTGEEEKNAKLTPISGGGYIYSLPSKLYKKLTEGKPETDAVQSELYGTLKENYDDIKRYKMLVYLKNAITGAAFSKKIVDTILSRVKNDYISSKWTKEIANDHWYDGFQSAISHAMDVGIIDIVSREYPFAQDYYGGTSYLFIENPWARTSALYDALIEAINEKPKTETPKENANSVKDNTSTSNPDPRAVNGKFTLKVKSGPGVIIGVTEVDIVEGKADFSGIEFDQAGDYVITVGCTSPDVDPMEINIKVLPPPEVIPQDSKGEPEPITGTRPIIAQIDRPIMDALGVKPMTFDRQGASVKDTKDVATTIGLTPFLNYNGSQVNDRDIQSFTLEHEGMIPKVTILFRDTNGMMTKEPPRDDTKFEIFLQSRSPNLKSIHLKFKIEDFKRTASNLYSLEGTLDVSKLYRNKFSVKRGTSFEALREICKDLGLGFNSNIENTKDNMPWRNIGDKQYKFMEEIIKHSYISEESFMAGYIDYYYCFNYVDIEKEMKRDISKDVGIDTGGVSDASNKDSNKIGKLILTSEKGAQTSNGFFIKVGERNESTKISMEQGYRTRTKFYDKVKKMFLVFDVDSTTSDGAKSHILKAGENDKESFDNNYVTKYEGKIDTDNTHVNYNYAVTQNRINLDNMMKNQMDIVLPNPNFNLYRFQKIKVFLVKDAATVASPENIQWRYSGEWMIASIKFNFQNGSLTQEITLARKELGKDPKEIKEGTNNGTKEKKEEKNENPIVGTASATITNKPNEKYKVGDVFTVQNAEGKYVLTVNKLSENGTDIVSTLKDPGVVPNQTLTNPNTTGASQSNTSGATTSEPSNINGEFTFNVEEENTFTGVNNQFGKLFIIGIGEIKEEPLEIPEDETMDEEYTEGDFLLQEKDMIFEVAEATNVGEDELEYATPPVNTKSSSGSGMSAKDWEKNGTMVIGSKVPSDLSGPANYNQNVTLNKTMKDEYLPTILKMKGYTNGIKLLAIVMAQKEGFAKGTRSYKTNNPGNIGNTDSGSNKTLKKLEDGIKLQLDYIKKVADGSHNAYQLNKEKYMKPYYSPEIAKNNGPTGAYKGMTEYVPGYKFTYTGMIEQYVKIYATGARTGNSYISMIVSWYRQNGYSWVTEETKISQLIEQNKKDVGVFA